MKKIFSFLAIALICAGCGNKEQVKHLTIIGENAATIQALMSLGSQYETQNKAIKLDFNHIGAADGHR